MIGSGKRTYTLGFRVALEDRFSKPAQQVKATLQGLKEENKMFTQNLTAARNLYGGMALAGAGALRALGGWVREGAQFEYIMRGVKAVSEATVGEYKQLTALANTLGQETMFMPEDIGSGMRYMAMAGQDAQTIFKTITAATNLAGATMTQLGGKLGAADILTNVLKGFQLSAEHSVRISDVLVNATTNANTSLVDLGNSLKYVSATSVDLGVPLETTTALAMALGNAGIQGSMAGTAMENMYRYLAMGLSEFRTNRQSKAWSALGLSPEDVMDATGNLRSMEVVLGKIRENLSGRGTIQVQGILKEIFGVRGKRAGSAVIRMMDDFVNFQDLLKNQSSGRAYDVMQGMMDSVQGDILKVISTFKSIKVAYTEAMAPIIRPTLQFLKQALGFVQRIFSNPVGKFVVQVGSIALVLLTVNAAIKTVIAGFGLMWRSGLTSLYGIKSALSLVTSNMTSFGASTRAAALASGTVMGGYFNRPGGKGRINVPKGHSVNYSEKRGMYYSKGPKGTGIRWMPKGSTHAMGGFMGSLGKIGGFMGKALGVLFPLGMAISIFLPLLSPILSKLTQSVEENKRMADFLAKREEQRLSAMFTDKQIIDVLGPKSMNELVVLFREAKESLKELHGIKGAIDKIEGKSGAEILFELLPLLNTKENVDLKPINYE